MDTKKYVFIILLVVSVVISIALLNLTGATEGYTETLDIQGSSEDTVFDNVVYDETKQGLRVEEGYNNGTYISKNYFKQEKATLENITGMVDYFENTQVVNLTTHLYNENNTVIREETINFVEEGETRNSFNNPLNISKNEYVNFKLYLERG